MPLRRHRLSGSFFAIVLTMAFAAAVAAAPPLPGFTAHYRVLQNGSPIGKATLTLAPAADGTWNFTTQSEGTAGLAAGETAFTLPVAVRGRIETQQYAVQGKQNVILAAGTFDATRVSRSD